MKTKETAPNSAAGTPVLDFDFYRVRVRTRTSKRRKGENCRFRLPAFCIHVLYRLFDCFAEPSSRSICLIPVNSVMIRTHIFSPLHRPVEFYFCLNPLDFGGLKRIKVPGVVHIDVDNIQVPVSVQVG